MQRLHCWNWTQGFVEVDSITEWKRGLGDSISKGPQQMLKGKDEDVLFNIPNSVTLDAGGAQGLGEGTTDKPGICTACHSDRQNIGWEEPLLLISAYYYGLKTIYWLPV